MTTFLSVFGFEAIILSILLLFGKNASPSANRTDKRTNILRDNSPILLGVSSYVFFILIIPSFNRFAWICEKKGCFGAASGVRSRGSNKYRAARSRPSLRLGSAAFLYFFCLVHYHSDFLASGKYHRPPFCVVLFHLFRESKIAALFSPSSTANLILHLEHSWY